MVNLEYHNVRIERVQSSKNVVVRGEVTNKTGRNYSTVAIRVLFFIKNITVINIVLSVNGLNSNSTKFFEKSIEDLEYNAIAKDITRYEVYTEGAF